ncbi:AAA family ATPase [Rhodococcus sp. D2-41]|uniref:AAA family ATPase n=1 Tax=Speluncibacter jeojiensis TaxID=2710754 RepID=A0A9X4LZX6_9ACTN|nr:AAA family ATPase [Rhodococcus sp. D2-41]MDG3012529.1 AAA family ATPase [Rhodococcus sp. D2-41]MDG3015354.1 AAA family ATPase [Corynebacteriales bacterium D3-21]
MSDLPLSRVEFTPRSGFDPASWYLRLPVVERLCADGFAFDRPVTVIVGENGTGKSTLLEAVAAAWRSGLTAADRLWSAGSSTEDTDLGRHLTCIGPRPRPHGGCFLRAESMHALFDSADATRPREGDQQLNALSHGQSFLQYIADRPVGVGLWLLDEPEAALSFQSCLALLGIIGDLAAEGSQVILATHSPILAACPDADIRVLDGTLDDPMPSTWEDLDMVRGWRMFLADPHRFTRHL